MNYCGEKAEPRSSFNKCSYPMNKEKTLPMKIYSCFQCRELFSKRSELMQHLNTHIEEGLLLYPDMHSAEDILCQIISNKHEKHSVHGIHNHYQGAQAAEESLQPDKIMDKLSTASNKQSKTSKTMGVKKNRIHNHGPSYCDPEEMRLGNNFQNKSVIEELSGSRATDESYLQDDFQDRKVSEHERKETENEWLDHTIKPEDVPFTGFKALYEEENLANARLPKKARVKPENQYSNQGNCILNEEDLPGSHIFRSIKKSDKTSCSSDQDNGTDENNDSVVNDNSLFIKQEWSLMTDTLENEIQGLEPKSVPADHKWNLEGINLQHYIAAQYERSIVIRWMEQNP